jgi:hypothetical protein
MNTISRVISIFVVVVSIVSGLTYVLWKNSQAMHVVSSAVQTPIQTNNASLTKPADLVIPSEYDRTVDLITGNYFKQETPTNLSGDDYDKFNQTVQSNWNNYNQKMGKPMLAWSASEVNSSAKKVFYPFSGPDFTTLYQMYPNAEHYVMVAQQRGEHLVDLRKLNTKAASQTMEVLGSAWNSFGSDGFFVTEYLFKYISQNKVKIGATTLIASFAHLHQFSIQKIVPITLNAQGEVQELPEDSPWNSVRLYMVKDQKQVVLDYLSMDLSNDGMKASPEQLAFFDESAKSPILLKAASHLPQHPGFTIVRDAMLKNTPMVVQDETGLDYAPLSTQFDTVLYGSFVKAYKVFATYNHQLAKAYKDRVDEKPLPFRIGYFKDGNYALIVATRKK